MKAFTFPKYGNTEVLEYKDVPTPVPKENEVLVKVHAASINEWDWGLLQGKPFINRLLFGLQRPKILALGCDIAGKVETVGSKVSKFKPGDEVFGDICESGWGGFAEYVSVNEKALVIKAADMTFEQAAATPQAAILALRGLINKRDIKPGQKVLINGAGGGVGTFAIQIAKSMGAEVTGVDHTEKLDIMRSLGADHVIDYTKEDFTQNGQHYDIILDVVAYRSIFDYKRALNPGGRFVMIGGPIPKIFQMMILGSLISLFGNKKLGVLPHVPNKGLDVIKNLFVSAKVKPVIDRTFPLTELPQAFRYYEEGHFKGKIVITM